MIRRSLCRSSPALVSADHITPLETITRSEEMSQRSGSASRARRIGLAKASPTIDIELIRSVLHGVEQLDGVEAAALHRDHAAADHQVAEGVEQPGAVHQRRRRQVARAGLGDPVGGGVEVRLGRQALACWPRRGRRTGRPGATSRPSARPSCRRCRAAAGGRRSDPTARRPGRAVRPPPRPRRRWPTAGTVRCRRRPTATCGCGAGAVAAPRCARRTCRGTRRRRRRRCPTGTRARRRRSGSSC